MTTTKTEILKVAGAKFARNDTALVSTLFEKGGTASGYFKDLKESIIFMDQHKKVFAALIDGVFVSCSPKGNRYLYAFGLNSKDKKRLGLDALTYREQCELAREISRQELDI